MSLWRIDSYLRTQAAARRRGHGDRGRDPQAGQRHVAHVTMHSIEGSRQEIEAQLKRSLDAFFDFYPEFKTAPRSNRPASRACSPSACGYVDCLDRRKLAPRLCTSDATKSRRKAAHPCMCCRPSGSTQPTIRSRSRYCTSKAACAAAARHDSTIQLGHLVRRAR